MKKVIFVDDSKTVLMTAQMSVKELVDNFGSQSVVFSLDYKKTLFSGYKVFIKSGTQKTKFSPLEIALKMENLGVGEIILNDIDRDGTFSGYNIDMIKLISSKLNIPLIASGGARNLNDFKLAKEAGASGCAAGAMFVYHMPHRAVVISYPKYEEIKKIAKSNIKILGYQYDEVLVDYMQRAKAFVYAAIEDFGIVPIEAMACGTPVIALDNGGTAETVCEGLNGVHFKKQSQSAIIEAVNRFENLEFDYEKVRESSLKYTFFKEKFREFVDSRCKSFF